MRVGRLLVIFGPVVCCVLFAPASWGLEAYGAPPTLKITPDETPSEAWREGSVRLDCAGNEWESCQIAVRSAEPVDDLTIQLGELRDEQGAALPAAAMQVQRVEWVDVNAPYEIEKTSEHPDLRPDPLVPVDPARDRFSVEDGRNLVFWVTIGVPEATAPGVYTGAIRLVSGVEEKPVQVQLRVRGFSLPKRPILQSMIGMASANIYKAHGCKTPEEKEQVIRLYFDEYIRARLSPFLYAPGTMAFNPLPDAGIKWEFVKGQDGELTGEAKLDFTRFDEEGRRYLDERQTFSAFNFAPYMWIKREVDGKKEMVLRFADAGGTAIERRNAEGSVNPLFDRLVVSVFRAIAAHLAEKGWLDRAIYYVTDEPSDDDTPAIKEICELVREADPRIRTALTYDPAHRPRLAELVKDGKSLVSVWVPYCSQYREDVAADQRAKGADYWLYDVADSCLISHSGEKNRAMFWLVWQRRAGGYLYYLSTWWGRVATPWERPNFKLPEYTYKYRHGDGYFFYPPLRQGAPKQAILDHVVRTIRWELMREGAEDYDYLRMLEDLTGRAQAKGLAQAAAGNAALETARSFAERVAGPPYTYAIRDLVFEPKPGWSFSAKEGWLHHSGGERSDLPIELRTKAVDGRYELVCHVYDDRDYRGRPYSRFRVNGNLFSSPSSNLKGPARAPSGTVEVQGGICRFTLSPVEEDLGVILYRVGLKRLAEVAAADLYAVRSEVADAIEALRAVLR